MKKLPRWIQKRICTNKEHQSKNQSKIDSIKKAKISAVDRMTTSGNNDSSSGPSLVDAHERVVAAVINGVYRASQHSTNRSAVQFPLNGRNATIASSLRSAHNPTSSSDDTSALTFDHSGDIV